MAIKAVRRVKIFILQTSVFSRNTKRQYSFYILPTNTAMHSLQLKTETSVAGSLEQDDSNHSSTSSALAIRNDDYGANFIDLVIDDIAKCDLATVFKFQEKPKQHMSGTMLGFVNHCFLITQPTGRYCKVVNNTYSKTEDIIMLADESVCKAFNYLTEHLTAKMVNTDSLPNPDGYYCDGHKCYLKVSPKITVFDKYRNSVPYSSQLWLNDMHYEAKFLIQLYGAYVYDLGGRLKMKISAKIVQIMLLELGKPFNASSSAMLETCLM